MKIMRIAAVALALPLGALAAHGQTPGPAPKAAAPAVVPKGKIAVVDSSVFQDELNEFKEIISNLRKRLEPRAKEMQAQADKISALENTLLTQGQILSTTRMAEMTDNLNAMKRDYQRKSEDLQQYVAQEQNQAFEPIVTKIGQFAGDYSSKRGIVILVDLTSALQAGALLWHDPAIDVTRDFVAEYNKANPVKTPAPKP